MGGKSENLFENPNVTFQELQDAVKEFLIPKEPTVEELEQAVQDEAEADEIITSESTSKTVDEEENYTVEPEQIVTEPNVVTEVETAVDESEKPSETNEVNQEQEVKDEKDATTTVEQKKPY